MPDYALCVMLCKCFGPGEAGMRVQGGVNRVRMSGGGCTLDKCRKKIVCGG